MMHRIDRKTWRSYLQKCMCMSITALLYSAAPAQAGERTSRWVSKAVVIDGNNNEWPQPYPFTEDENTKIQYAIANDAQMLYLTVKTSDNATKMKLRNNGFSIVIDTTGKKLSTMLFDFTAQVKNAGAQADTNQQLNISEVRLKNTAGYDGSYKPADNKTGVTAAGLANDFTELVVEIAIPFKCIYPADAEGHVKDKDRLGIGFNFYGLSNASLDELQHTANDSASNAMAMPVINSKGALVVPGEDDGSGAPARGANGAMGIGIGGGKGKGGHSGTKGAPEIDANAMMLDRQRAAQDNEVWKVIRLGHEG